MTEGRKCHYCDKPSTALCDHIITVVASETPFQSCDRPICNDHRRKVGHICDRSSRTKNNNSDTIDHCAMHVFEGTPR